jgi:SNF2 family DNA or RNA helicase
MIRQYLGYSVPCITGGMSVKEKTKILDAFGRKEIPLLLCHPASMSHGINDLQHVCNKVVYYALPWSLEQYQQLNARVVRRGQQRPVVIYHLIAKDTIYARVSEILRDKNATQEQFKKAIMAECERKK